MKLIVALAFLAVASADLWGITPQNQLIKLDQENGLWTLQGCAFADHHLTPLIQISDVDESANTFYLMAVNRTDTDVNIDLLGVSTTSGQILYDLTLPYHFSFNYIDTPGLDYIPGSHDVLVYGPTVDLENYKILRITPATGAVTTVTTWAKEDAVIQSVDAFDSANNILWLELEENNQINTLGFDIVLGALKFNLTDEFGMQSLNFDPQMKRTIGLGSPVGETTPLVALDGLTGKFTEIAKIQGAYTVSGPDNAGFDVTNRVLFQYVDNGSTTELLAINVDQGTTYTVAFTAGSSVIPSTIAFFN